MAKARIYLLPAARNTVVDNGEAGVAINPAINPGALADLEELGSSPGFMDKLIGAFVADNGTLLAKMESALSRRDVGEFRIHVHAMRSSAASMGAERLTAYCRDVGRLTDAEIKVQGLLLLKSLRGELATTRDALDRYLQGRRRKSVG